VPDREAVFFRTPAEWRAWLAASAGEAGEVWVGFFRRAAGESGITWREAVDEALCCGWIDGVRQGIDAGRYRIRFTPRKATSIWSTVNVARVEQLSAEGRMGPAGLEAFARRRASHSGVYSHEQSGEPELGDEQRAAFEGRPGSWEFLQAQAPSYRKAVLWWVVNAKRAETRATRLATVVDDCAAGRQVRHLRRGDSGG
jgi:uncharacterized protein YdeI (YjbR/CyaY-like superfamily)